jgi:hypothetical protein
VRFGGTGRARPTLRRRRQPDPGLPRPLTKGFVGELVFDEDSWQGLYSVRPRVIADYLLEHRLATFRGLYANLDVSVTEQPSSFPQALAAATTMAVGAIDVAVVPVEDALDAVGHARLVQRFLDLTKG